MTELQDPKFFVPLKFVSTAPRRIDDDMNVVLIFCNGSIRSIAVIWANHSALAIENAITASGKSSVLSLPGGAMFPQFLSTQASIIVFYDEVPSPKKPLVREVHRVVREELEGTLKELLTVNDQARSTAVHEARKHLEKVRALIRLLRPATGEAFYKRENAAMRKAAERMSSIRDSHVRVQTIKKLIAKSGKRRAPAAFARIEAANQCCAAVCRIPCVRSCNAGKTMLENSSIPTPRLSAAARCQSKTYANPRPCIPLWKITGSPPNPAPETVRLPSNWLSNAQLPSRSATA